MNIPANLAVIPTKPTTAEGEKVYRDQVAEQVVWMLVHGTRHTPEAALSTWETESNVELSEKQREGIISRIEW